MIIVGAGLAGLITAHAFPRAAIFEASPEPRMSHRALLRFRSDAVARLTGIEFRAVKVRKGVYREGEFREPTIGEANRYSMKCLGELVSERSIWNLEPVTRFVAPETFHEQLVESVFGRVHYDSPVNLKQSCKEETVVSTAPLDVALNLLGVSHDIEFKRAGINVLRARIPNADVFQTIYFTNPTHNLYRASITGDVLIAEFVGEPESSEFEWLALTEITEAFHLPEVPYWEERVQQKYGKIAPIEEGLRKRLVARLTDEYGLYSIGRFATWRNILLDDVVKDAELVKRLINSAGYDRRIAAL